MHFLYKYYGSTLSLPIVRISIPCGGFYPFMRNSWIYLCGKSATHLRCSDGISSVRYKLV